MTTEIKPAAERRYRQYLLPELLGGALSDQAYRPALVAGPTARLAARPLSR